MAVGRFPGLRQVATQTPGSNAPIVLTLSSLASGTVDFSTVATPSTGRTVVDVRIERSPNGVSGWQSVTLPARRRVSELPAPSTKTPTKYVDPSGSYQGNAAFTTIQAAVDASVAGDEIAVSPTIGPQKVLFTRSGSAANPIRVRCADYNNKPTIDATFLSTNWVFEDLGSNAVVSINAEYIIWDGINVVNARNNNQNYDWGGGTAFKIGACRNNGSFIFNGEKDTWYKGIRIYRSNISNCATAVQALMCEDYTIGGCDISGTQKGNTWDSGVNPPITWGSGVGFNGRQGKFIENTVRQSMGEGIHIGYHGSVVESANPILAFGHRDFVVRGNVFYDCWSEPIYLTVASGGVIEENLVFMTNAPRYWYNRSNTNGFPKTCIGLGTELGAFGNPVNVLDQTWAGVENVVIRNNILNGAQQVLRILNYNPTVPVSGYRNIDIEHNTIFATRGSFPSEQSAIYNEATVAQYNMSGFRFRNNAVLVDVASNLSKLWNSLGTGKVVQGNCFSHTPPADLASGTDVINAGSTVLADKSYVVSSSDGYPNPITFDVTKAYPYLSGSTVSPLVDRVASIGTLRDFFGNTRPTDTGRADIGAISLSMLNTYSASESGLAAGTYFYRASFTDSVGDVGVSDVKSISVSGSDSNKVLDTKFDGIAIATLADFGLSSKDYYFTGSDASTGQVFSLTSPQIYGAQWGTPHLQTVGADGLAPDAIFSSSIITSPYKALRMQRLAATTSGAAQQVYRLRPTAPWQQRGMIYQRLTFRVDPTWPTTGDGSQLLMEEKYGTDDISKVQCSWARESSSGKWWLIVSIQTDSNSADNGAWAASQFVPLQNSTPIQTQFFRLDGGTYAGYYFQGPFDGLTSTPQFGRYWVIEFAYRLADAASNVYGNGSYGWIWCATSEGIGAPPTKGTGTQRMYLVGRNTYPLLPSQSNGEHKIFQFGRYEQNDWRSLTVGKYVDILQSELYRGWPADASSHPGGAV